MRIIDNGSLYSVSLSARETYDWAHRSGASWPCSTLANRRVWAQFDKRNGDLVDLEINGFQGQDIDGRELTAIMTDYASARVKARGWEFNEL